MGWPWTKESPRLQNSMLEDHSWPRVSIVTPSYNQGEFIEETIRSVLLQGYGDLEYIIMDGGSTDGSVDIIRKYEQWLTRWVSEPDQGQTHAINQGWEYASGQIFAYLNSDDYYLPGAITAVVKGFETHPQAGMIYGTAIIIDESGEHLGVWNGQPFDLKIMLTIGSIVPQPAAFFSKHALTKVGYLDEHWHMIMDYELCVRIALQFPTVYLSLMLAKFRDHFQSKSHSHYEKTAGELIQWLRVFYPPQVSPKDWRTIRQITLSRVHYEWALNYLARGPEHASKALLQLIKSIFQYTLFALKRPMGTAYIIKEIFLSYIKAIYARLTLQN